MSTPEHPSKTSDVVSAVQKLSSGEPLSNVEMTKGLGTAVDKLEERKEEVDLGPHSTRVVEDLEALLLDLRMGILEKNSDEKVGNGKKRRKQSKSFVSSAPKHFLKLL